MTRSRFARGTQRTEHDPAAVRREVRRETMRQARVAAFRGDHAEASRLYALCDVVYVHEVQIYEPHQPKAER